MARLWTRREAAEYFSVCPHTIDAWRRRGILQGIKIGGNIRFDADALIDAMQADPLGTAEKGGKHE